MLGATLQGCVYCNFLHMSDVSSKTFRTMMYDAIKLIRKFLQKRNSLILKILKISAESKGRTIALSVKFHHSHSVSRNRL